MSDTILAMAVLRTSTGRLNAVTFEPQPRIHRPILVEGDLEESKRGVERHITEVLQGTVVGWDQQEEGAHWICLNFMMPDSAIPRDRREFEPVGSREKAAAK